MTRQHLLLRPCGAIATRRHFQHKFAYANDELHPRSLYPHGVLMDVTPAPGRTYTRATWPPQFRGRGESLYSPRRIKAKLRAAEAFSLWQAGYTWQAIANQLGYAGRSGAWRAVRRLTDRADFDAWRKAELKKYR